MGEVGRDDMRPPTRSADLVGDGGATMLERAVTVLGCRFRQNYASSETGPLPISSLPPEDHDPSRGRLGGVSATATGD